MTETPITQALRRLSVDLQVAAATGLGLTTVACAELATRASQIALDMAPQERFAAEKLAEARDQELALAARIRRDTALARRGDKVVRLPTLLARDTVMFAHALQDLG